MSVLIRGMEMPTSCFDCQFMYGRRYCRANSKIEFNDPDYSELKGRYDGCPLIPVPSHGRLIDADEFMRDECNNCDGACESISCDCVNCHADCRCEFMRDILDAPTVIPAEGES